MAADDRSRSSRAGTSHSDKDISFLPATLHAQEIVHGAASALGASAPATVTAVRNSASRFVFVVLGSALLAVAAWLVVRTAIPDFFVASTMRDLSTVIDINPLVAKLLEVIMYFLAFTLVGSLLSFSGERQRRAMLVSTIGFSVIYGSAWFLTRDVWFDKEGNSLKCYVITNEGVQLFDTKRVDPKTGKRCKSISQQMAPALQRLVEQQKRNEPVAPVDPNTAVAFSQRTGEQLLWYTEKESGEVLFFDVPGFDRDTGKPFKSVTPEYWRVTQRQLAAARIGDARVLTRVIFGRNPDGGAPAELQSGLSLVVDGIDGEFAFVRDGDRPWKVRLSDLNNSSRRAAR